MRIYSLFTLIMITLLILPVPVIGSEIPEDTIIAEYDGGSITYGDLTFRISKIPPMYQSRYETNEGKTDLLDMLCTEEMFYIEAKNSGADETEEFASRLHFKLVNLYTGEYKNEISNQLVISEDRKKDFYDQNYSTFYLDREFEDVEADIEMRLKPELLAEKVQTIIDSGKIEANVIIHYENFSEDAVKSGLNEENRALPVIESSSPDLRSNLEFFYGIYELLPTRKREMAFETEGRKEIVDDLVELEILNWHLKKEGFDQKQEIREMAEQIRRNLMLQTTYNQLVVDKIDVTEESMQQYYQDNIDKFSSIGYRKIQAFVFEKKEMAEEARKKVEKFLKKDDHESISELIENETVNPRKDGIIDHIYDNGIIPGIGKDELYSDMVWEKEPGQTSPGELSGIFKNSRDNFVFFRVLEDNIATPKPYEDVKDNVKAKLNKEMSNERFELVKQELSDKYSLVKYPERSWIILTPQEYFLEAENSQKNRKFHEAIYYYDQIIKYHQNNTDDYKATFMKAFLYAEELKENKKAIEEFESFLDKYPEGDLHESARFMLMDLRGENDLQDIFED